MDRICVYCQQVEENISHLFFSYDFSKFIWEWSSNNLNITYNYSQTIEDIVESIINLNINKDIISDLTCIVVSSSIWAIWNRRNIRIFGEKLLDIFMTCNEIKNHLSILMVKSKKKIQNDLQITILNNLGPRSRVERGFIHF